MNLLLIFLLAVSSLTARPAQVILIRHAEKLSEGGFLSLKGRERAAALVPCFQGNPLLTRFGTPAAVYAMNPNNEDASLRSMQTVLELADQFHLPLQTGYSYGETKQMADEILASSDYEGKMILVCWPHRELPILAQQLGAKKVPLKWADDIFDRFWMITYEPGREIPSFQNLPQKLLYGDSSR